MRYRWNHSDITVCIATTPAGCEGGSVAIEVHSDKFAGKSLVVQHRMVFDLIKDITKNVHAIRIETKHS
jgi:stress-induced morphogen